MVTDRNVADDLIAGGVNHGDAPTAPITYVNAFAVARDFAIVGIFTDGDLRHHLPGRQVNDGYFVRQVFGHVQSLAVRRHGDARWKCEFTEALAASLGALAVIELVIIAAAQNDLARLLGFTV